MFKVIWQRLPGKSVIKAESFPELEDALKAADVRLAVQPTPVEISVVDEEGVIRFTRVCG